MSADATPGADIGNSNTGIGLFEDDIMVGSWSAETDARATDDELAATVTGLLALDGHRLDDVRPPPWPASCLRSSRAGPGCLPAGPGSAGRGGRGRARRDPRHRDRPARRGRRRPAGQCPRRSRGVRRPGDRGRPRHEHELRCPERRRGVHRGRDRAGPGHLRSMHWSAEPRSCRGSSWCARPHAIGTNTIAAMQSGTVNGYIGLLSGLLAAIRGELVERSPDRPGSRSSPPAGSRSSPGSPTCPASTGWSRS